MPRLLYTLNRRNAITKHHEISPNVVQEKRHLLFVRDRPQHLSQVLVVCVPDLEGLDSSTCPGDWAKEQVSSI